MVVITKMLLVIHSKKNVTIEMMAMLTIMIMMTMIAILIKG